jgi:phosphatidate phosphatase APP1
MSRPAASFCALLTLSAAVASAEPQILLFPGIGRPDEVTVHGRVLKQAPTRGSSRLSRNLRQLTAPDWEGAPVEISFQGATLKTRAGEDGVFEATFSFALSEAPPPGWRELIARVPGAVARGSVRIVDPRAPFLVISDFDDTVAVTNVLDRRRFLDAALLQDARTQPAIPGMSAFYQCLVEDRAIAAPLAFVSGSPQQYAPRIAAFLRRNGFPLAALYLRDLSPRTLSDYKQPAIRSLLRAVPQKVILIGDSGEHDPEVYAQIRGEFPERVLAIYIHDVGRSDDRARFEGMTLFQDANQAALDAVKRGWLAEECRARKLDAPHVNDR